MSSEDTGTTRLLQIAAPSLAWVHRNPQLAWAIASAIATALVVGGAAIAIFKTTLGNLQDAQEADRKHITEALGEIGTRLDDLKENGSKVTNANIKALSERMDRQEAWRDRVEAAAEIRIPRSRK